MANDMNQCNFTGRLGRDPESRTSNNGGVVTNFSIAVGWKTKESEGVEWVPIATFGRLAEVGRDYLRKGSMVRVTGRFRTRKWQDKNGQDRYTTEIVAHEFQMLDRRPGESAPDASAHQAAAPAEAEFDDDIPF